MLIDFKRDFEKLEFSPRANSVLEVWTVANEAPIVPQRDRKLNENEIDDWLFERVPEYRRPIGAISGLKVISNMDFRSPTISFTQDYFGRLLDGLRLPKHFARACLHGSFSHFAKFSTGQHDANGGVIGFVARTLTWDVTWSLALSYFPKTGVTNILLRGLEESDEAEGFPSRLQTSAQLAAYPMLVPVLLADLLFNKYEGELTNYLNRRVILLENAIGQVPYLGARDVKLEDLQSFELTKDLNMVQRSIRVASIRFKTLQMFLENITTTSTTIESILADQRGFHTTSEERYSQFQEASTAVNEHMRYLQNYISHMQLRVNDLEARCTSQLTVVYNFMALQENRIGQRIADESKRIADLSNRYAEESRNIAEASKMIAEDSKRIGEESTRVANQSNELAAAARKDSSALLGIALLTMFFLPATFVSTLLSLPMFDWTADTANGEEIVSDRFRVYWAVTIPLTVLVLGVYGTWMFKPWFKSLVKRPDSEKRGST